MRNMIYKVNLISKEQAQLSKLVKSGTESAHTINRARVLLYTHAHKSIAEIKDALAISHMMIVNIRRRFQTECLGLLHDRPRPVHPRKVDGKLEAIIIATAYSTPPKGTDHWTMRMIAQKIVELDVVEYISHKTVWEHLKNDVMPWLKQMVFKHD